jgi:hypothetical protein
MRRLFALLAVFALGFACPRVGRADTLLLGDLSFDSGVSPDGNSFDLYNLTGGLIDPDGIIDDLEFSGTLVVTPASGPLETYTFSGIDDAGGTIVTIPDDVDVVSAVLSITLSSTTGVNIYDDSGNPAVVSLASVDDVSLPLNGLPALTPCDGSGSTCSSAAFYVDTASASAVPEPATWELVLTGLAALAGCGRRLRRT